MLLVVVAVVACFAGAILVERRARFDVGRSLNPKLRRYLLGFLVLGAGLVLLVFSSECRHLSAWTIGTCTGLFSVGARLWGLSMGYVIPELMRVVAVLGAGMVMMIVLAFLRPGC